MDRHGLKLERKPEVARVAMDGLAPRLGNLPGARRGLVTYCAVNWLTIAQARRQTEMHSGRQRAEV